ncbi:hypothetical protein GCM10027180_28440 [Microbulbifer echini]
MAASNKVKPIVAPDTNGIVRAKPCCTPDEMITILTGPGVIDIVKEKPNIANSKDILNPYSF